MKRWSVASLLMVAGASLAFSGAVRADEGMWLVNKPPLEQLARHGFKPDAAWLENAMKASVRFSTGGSGSFVSKTGLVMTNHHVASDMLAKLSTPERNIMETGFLATSQENELACPDLELNVLWDIIDVTDRVKAAGAGKSPAEANTERRKMMATIEKEIGDKTGLMCQTVTLYQGGKYHLYCYKRFTDVRVVFAPEKQAAFFGGDADNFEYPRHCLDCTFFRVYENGKPYVPEHFFPFSPDGSKEGDLAMVFGHPGRTQRLNTMAHLAYLRDHAMPRRLDGLWRAEIKAQTFAGRSRENARIIEEELFGIANGRKAVTGQYSSLLDPKVMGRKREAEQRLRSAVSQNAEWNKQWGDAWDKLAAAEAARAGWIERAAALGGLDSPMFGIAQTIVRLAAELPKPSAERLREFRDSNLENIYLELYSPAPMYPALETYRLESSLLEMAETLGGEDPAVIAALAGKSPRDRAEQLVTNSKLIDPAERKKLVEGGKAAIDASTDPLIRLAAAMDDTARQWRKKAEDEVDAVERESYAKIAAAKFAVEGENTYPDATFTLRMSFGPIRGFEADGAKVPAYTTIGGLFEKAAERAGDKQFDLPAMWAKNKDRLKLSTPYNFVCTADIIGGNSGSPVVNTRGEVIGLIFDGNIDSLGWAFAYSDERGRAVAVDSRALIEAMKSVYGAETLAKELTGR
jgi:hypothetical protein